MSIEPNPSSKCISEYIQSIIDTTSTTSTTTTPNMSSSGNNNNANNNNIMGKLAVNMTSLTYNTIDLTNINQFGYETKSVDVETTLYQDMTKQCNQVVKFILSSLRHLQPLERYMEHMAFRTLLRIAGFKTIMLLYQKVDDLPKKVPSLVPISSMSIQPAALEFLVPCLYTKSMVNSNAMVLATAGSSLVALTGSISRHPSSNILDSSQILNSNNTNVNPTMTSSTYGRSNTVSQYNKSAHNMEPFPIIIDENEAWDGHYTVGLKCVHTHFLTELSKSFESLYEYIAQLLSRATWGGYRNVQCIALATWGITISIDDHFFLNRLVCVL